MPKIRTLFILGIALMLLHIFPGFPIMWKSAFSIGIGALVSLFTFLHYKDMKKKYTMREVKKTDASVFVENTIERNPH